MTIILYSRLKIIFKDLKRQRRVYCEYKPPRGRLGRHRHPNAGGQLPQAGQQDKGHPTVLHLLDLMRNLRALGNFSNLVYLVKFSTTMDKILCFMKMSHFCSALETIWKL